MGTEGAAALDQVQADPVRARELALAARRRANRAGDRAELSLAERVLGLAARELHDAPAALRHLRRAVRVAEAPGLRRQGAEARMSLALVLAEAGHPGRALREIDAAAPALSGLPAARLAMQRALILDRLSRFDEAMTGYTTAYAEFRRAGDRLWQARALTNRGVLHAYRGRVRDAEADLLAAGDLYEQLGQELALAQVRHNLGFVLARAGDLPAALRWYDRADEYFARTARPAVALMDRGELLLDARLLPEARAAAEAALTAARTSRMRLFEAQARLLVAEAALAGGDTATARSASAAAHRQFVRQDRPAWAALARYVGLTASDTPAPVRLRRARQVADELDAAGWPAPALDARLYAARLALARAAAEPGSAARLIRQAAADLRHVRGAGRRGPAQLRARAWHAEALLRDATGDPARARRALLAGMAVLRRYSAALGATELRTLTGAYAIDLAATGLRMAVRGGRARSILWWGERWKATALRLPPTRPPDEATLAADLDQLRRVHAEIDQGTAGMAALLREQRSLEERIRRRSWRASGAAPGDDVTDAGLPDLPDRLGDRTLVELLESGGALHAVVVSARGFRARPVGDPREAGRELEALRFALARIVRRHGTATSLAAAREAAAAALTRLDGCLFDAVRPWLPDGPLVVVPAGELHATPWALLPSCRGRPVTVAPSASAWLAAAGPPVGLASTGPPVGLVAAGPPEGLVAAGPPEGLVAAGPPEGLVAAGPPEGLVAARPSEPGRTADSAWPTTAAPTERSAWPTGTGPAGPRREPGRPRTVLVAGPGLAHAETEIRRLVPMLPGAVVLTGAGAAANAVRAALDGADLAHVAAHGVFRADNPMFSYLRLADGPLTIYDLERLARLPRTVVLSACNAGLSAVHPGEELMGLTAALLGLGTRTVLASVLPARDETTADLMAAVHHRLAAGEPASHALAHAQREAGDGLGEQAVSAAAFTCFGAG